MDQPQTDGKPDGESTKGDTNIRASKCSWVVKCLKVTKRVLRPIGKCAGFYLKSGWSLVLRRAPKLLLQTAVPSTGYCRRLGWKPRFVENICIIGNEEFTEKIRQATAALYRSKQVLYLRIIKNIRVIVQANPWSRRAFPGVCFPSGIIRLEDEQIENVISNLVLLASALKTWHRCSPNFLVWWTVAKKLDLRLEGQEMLRRHLLV